MIDSRSHGNIVIYLIMVLMTDDSSGFDTLCIGLLLRRPSKKLTLSSWECPATLNPHQCSLVVHIGCL